MSALSSKLRLGEDNAIMFWCPGCDCMHQVWVGEGKAPRWGYNGNADAPTFTPSILLRSTWWEPAVTPDNFDEWEKNPWEQKPVERICHSFVTDGKIQFLSDSTHHLSGQTVDIPDFEE